ncbi:pyrroline-5-carboxylate reductase [Pseudomonas rubra]|uniref:Pyrroline-5-carboxylate reductase n=1 Tax=Pseudomonas rubra TaxID=2942627 RepID=A0ABT5P9F2_9PSED|nr:pyrroline-5-carboxylate reductase [Pseudomonas rubra]MDD1014796.1 pyrroline-5-carboxylate reductase [Pseudomonas rubra]MDD1036504.1 pyrroline-5-carboxylate reductase [Pseudomonas rubra]MDD1158023.1 pyrroline-5-carboxylate reductase [Pseudomonas rubra]
MSNDIVLVGAGCMGAALLPGLFKGFQKSRILVVDTSPLRREKVAAMGVDVASAIDNIDGGATVVLALPPNSFSGFASSTLALKGHAGLVISVMAGVRIATIKHALQICNVVRAIPNTPAETLKSMTVFCAATSVSLLCLEFAERVLSLFGEAIRVESENLMDPATAICGGGPAYISYFAECMRCFAVEQGFNDDESALIVAQVLCGTGSLLSVGDRRPMQLCRDVMTPGGTTARAVEVLDRNNFKEVVGDALLKATIHSRSLGCMVEEAENERSHR